jgi:hypothetical protein
MLINAKIDGLQTLYRTTVNGTPLFTISPKRAADIPATMIDGVIVCLKIKMPAAKFWREGEPEPDCPPSPAL